MTNTAYDYSDIWLTPKYSTVTSREQCDPSVKFGPLRFALPIVPANMKTIIGEELVDWLCDRNLFYVMHRFEIDNIEFCKRMRSSGKYISISVGVKESDKKLIKELESLELYPEYITIDIAHGNSKVMKEMLTFIKGTKVGENSFIIAGNVCDQEGAVNLCKWGADAIKVGVGPGCFISDTKVKTKEGSKCIQDVKKGDYVLTHTGEYKKVLGSINRMEEDRLVTVNGKFTSTPQHEYYVIRKCDKNKVTEDNLQEYALWIEAEKLSNDYLLVQYK